MCKPRQTKRGQESPPSSPARPRPRSPRRSETMARKGVSYVTAAQLVSMVRDPRVAIIDVRDEERICDAHIAGSHHYASDGFADRLPEIAEATRAKETLVFHCALSQVRPLPPSFSVPLFQLLIFRIPLAKASKQLAPWTLALVQLVLSVDLKMFHVM
uniref:Rhodanese domain-containing protein n=1 Tax=Triticum urartu TaxID=4572 RepID=A0A8R7UM31_TRIUA